MNYPIDKLGGPAFPSTVGDRQYFGMSLRDYFAAKAMQGMCANSGLLDPTFEGHRSSMSKAAYFLADAMLAERDK